MPTTHSSCCCSDCTPAPAEDPCSRFRNCCPEQITYPRILIEGEREVRFNGTTCQMARFRWDFKNIVMQYNLVYGGMLAVAGTVEGYVETFERRTGTGEQCPGCCVGGGQVEGTNCGGFKQTVPAIEAAGMVGINCWNACPGPPHDYAIYMELVPSGIAQTDFYGQFGSACGCEPEAPETPMDIEFYDCHRFWSADCCLNENTFKCRTFHSHEDCMTPYLSAGGACPECGPQALQPGWSSLYFPAFNPAGYPVSSSPFYHGVCRGSYPRMSPGCFFDGTEFPYINQVVVGCTTTGWGSAKREYDIQTCEYGFLKDQFCSGGVPQCDGIPYCCRSCDVWPPTCTCYCTGPTPCCDADGLCANSECLNPNEIDCFNNGRACGRAFQGLHWKESTIWQPTIP